MRKKLLFQAVISVLLFASLWFCLSLLPWNQWFKIKDFSKRKQEQFSNMMLKVYSGQNKEINDENVLEYINIIRDKICLANSIDTSSVHIHVIRGGEVNALTLPMGHIIVYTALIGECDAPDVLAGVMAHEIAHAQLNHISKRFAKQIALSAIAGVLK